MYATIYLFLFYPNRIVIDHTQYSKVQYNKNP